MALIGKMTFTWLCLCFIIVPNLGGWFGGIAVSRNRAWYFKNVVHSPASPPNWLIGPIWTILYCLMGVASYLVWEERKWKSWIPLLVYLGQLLLNWGWPWLFFELRNLTMALVDLILLDITVAVCIVLFGIVRLMAGALLVPYMIWLIYASYLNFYAYSHTKV
ncbi:hypothetical protein GE061_014655 [Apolygus lucorum]|uniref:Translocator protein n=1 Tax=Apolygus lucorum TaxID=248454 RepID=A0A8S9XIT8_APOLU|nr:hypothetical protein GE061_014655 [Apolygus lucorum]